MHNYVFKYVCVYDTFNSSKNNSYFSFIHHSVSCRTYYFNVNTYIYIEQLLIFIRLYIGSNIVTCIRSITFRSLTTENENTTFTKI